MLSTPPAFILSQDQTLIFKFVCPASFHWLTFLVVFSDFSLNFVLNFLLRYSFQCLYPVGIFRVALLFICQGSMRNASRIAGKMLRISHSFVVAVVLRRNSDIISCAFLFVNNFLKLFSKSFLLILKLFHRFPRWNFILSRHMFSVNRFFKNFDIFSFY